MHDEGRPALFILSPADRDGLAALASRNGWRAIAARRPRDAERRYLASDALVALVDARNGRTAEALVRRLAPAVEANGGALIALVEDAGEAVLPMIAAGATHYLVAPVTAASLDAAFASARRMVERLGGGVREARDRHAIERSDSLHWRLDRDTGLLSFSPELGRRLGIGDGARAARTMLRMIPAADRSAALSAMRDCATPGSAAAFAHDLPDRAGQRAAHHLHRDAGGIVGEVEILPATGRREEGERDYLTGLGNRQAAIAWLTAALAGDGDGLAVLLLSVGQFDRMNAAYGQLAGDALLGRVARRIERMVEDVAGPSALVARVAGTEFLVGLPGRRQGEGEGGTERAKFLAQRLVAAIAQPFSAGDHLLRLSGRCGIAEMRRGDDALRLLRRASGALADARNADAGAIRLRTADRHSREVDGDRLEADLRLALDRGEIDIVFQPQYATADDRLTGVEALARWTHPHYGPLGAGVLFAAAARSDFLLPLSAHIQAQALKIAAAWPPALSGLRLSVNVTATDIAQPDFLPAFLSLVDGSGFSRSRLTVEITESGLIEDLEGAAALLSRLRAEGLALAIDDFGTGYSSLAYLKALPLDYLKIDSGLAQDIAGSPRDSIIVRGVIHMAKSLNLKVVAEGVETQQQLGLLAREGCDFYQGFLRSAGVSSADLAALVKGSG